MSEGDGLVLAHAIDELTNRVNELIKRVAELTEELATEKWINTLLQQANMTQSAELQKLRNKEKVLP